MTRSVDTLPHPPTLSWGVDAAAAAITTTNASSNLRRR